MNSEQCVKMLEALESGCQSEAVFWAALVRFVENSSPSESEQLHEAQLRVADLPVGEQGLQVAALDDRYLEVWGRL